MVISIWQMEKSEAKKIKWLAQSPNANNNGAGIWPPGTWTSETKFFTNTLNTSFLVVPISKFLLLLQAVYIPVSVPSPSLNYTFLKCKNHILLIVPLPSTQEIEHKEEKIVQ